VGKDIFAIQTEIILTSFLKDATTTFQQNDDIDIFGAVIGLNNNTLSVNYYP